MSQVLSLIDSTKELEITLSYITEKERKLLESLLPANIKIVDQLSSKTNYLVMYKVFFTEKYLSARMWNIPVLHVNWLYNTTDNPKSYYLEVFEGVKFINYGNVKPASINFYTQQGALLCNSLFNSTGFVLLGNECKNKHKLYLEKKTQLEESENLKDIIDTCLEFKIPIIFEYEMYEKDISYYKRSYDFISSETEDTNIFENKTFCVDENIEKALYNLLKRIIIENSGIRISEKQDVDFYISNKKENSVSYQLILESDKIKRMLDPRNYKIEKKTLKKIFSGFTFVIEKNVYDPQKLKYQIKALGGNIRKKIDYNTTHVVSNTLKRTSKNKKVVNEDWVDKCLEHLRIKQDYKKLDMVNEEIDQKIKINYNEEKEDLVQFTALSAELKEKAKRRLDDLEIKYEDCEELLPNCTHLITGSIVYSSKLMIAVAQGTMVISKEFIGSTGHSLSKFCFKEEKTKQGGLYNSSVYSMNYWYKKINNTGIKPFNGWICKVESKDIKKILERGGAQITEGENFTHLFYDKIENVKENSKINSASKLYANKYILKFLLRVNR